MANFTSVLNQGSNLEAPDGKLVTDSQVKDELDKYVKLDGTNVTDENRSGLIGKLSNGASLETPKNAVVTDTFLKNSLADKATKAELAEKADKTSVDNKANKNLDNIGNIADKAKTTLTEALGTGTVTENDTHLVTGKTVHEALKGKADADLSNVSKDTIMEKVSKGNVTSTTLKITNGENAALHAMTVDLKEGSIEKKHLGEGLSKTIDDLEAKDKEHDKAISTIAKQSIQNTKNINYIHNAVQENKQAIANNARRIEAVDRKVNKTAALSTAMASLDFGKVKTGKIAVGAGIGGYHNEQAVAVGVAYQPTEDLLLTAKFSGVTGNPKYNSYGASVSYQFSVK